MLSAISIRNLVIVRELELNFSAGMSALTGETGAGKSILIDALGLTLGDKTDNSMIGPANDKAEVTSSFDLNDCPAARDWLEAHDLADDDQCLLRRVLVRDGRSRAYINGRPSPQTALRELGELLLDIHGQHAHQSLLRATAQRELLDAYAGLQDKRAAVAEAYSRWQQSCNELQTLKAAAADRGNRLDYLRFQLEELSPLIEPASDIEQLDQEHKRLANAESLQGDCGALLGALADEEPAISSSLAQLNQQLIKLAQTDPALAETQALLDSAGIQIDEAVQNLRHYIDQVALDPARLADLDQLIGQLHDCARKHRAEIHQLPALAEQLQSEFDALDQSEQQLDTLEQAVTEQWAAYLKLAKALSKSRQQAAKKLSKTVTESMQQLGMQGGVFQAQCQAQAEQAARHGIDQVQFEVAANPGQSPAPLNAVASGGELSRISLAIQVATADCGQVPTLIFDEVDVGIGGAVAEIVGQLLCNLGGRRQVLCVTHLPQVAAQAHQHYRVQKSTDGRSTQTQISELDTEKRTEELARMLGGVDITDQTRRHANEMIARAQQAS